MVVMINARGMQRCQRSVCQGKKTNMTNRLVMLLIMLSIAVGCKKQVSQECIQAKIIRITCAGTVMQALNKETIGEDNWSDMFTNIQYDHVFGVANSCMIGSQYKTSDTVYITIGKAVTSDCVHCALYDASPKTAYEINAIGRQPCSGIPR